MNWAKFFNKVGVATKQDITNITEKKKEVVEIFDHLEKLKFSPSLPKAFTEKGLYMLATILKSKRATETTIEIVETFAKTKNTKN
jgi:hypothetical protein